MSLEGTAEINFRSYTVKQVHFHAKSEHTINGQHYPLEGHFVHKAQDGSTAVIGVMFKEGAENKSFQQILDAATADAAGEVNVTIDSLDLSLLFPPKLNYYHYLGSLTTPPLTENVEWYVLKDPVEISHEQLNDFYKYYDNNNRETQQLNGRQVFEFE
ncbi:Carbonic anhydrase precursor [compost metagenome]